MNKKRVCFVLFFCFIICLAIYPQDTPSPTPTPLPDEYICHVSCDGIPGGIEVRYYGDHEGKAVTPFDIGPFPNPFRVVLEPTVIDIKTSDFDGLYMMGWQWADNENPYPHPHLLRIAETRPSSPEISIGIKYFEYSAPTPVPTREPVCVPPCPESTKAPPPFWDNITIAGLTFSIPGHDPDKIMVGIQIYSTIARALDWGTPSLSNNVITIDTQLVEWKGQCPQEETWLYHSYDIQDLVPGEEYTLIINGWGYEMGSYTFTHDEPVPTPFTPFPPPWDVYHDPNVTVRYHTIDGITYAELTMMFFEGETNLYSFLGWGILQESGNTFTAEPIIFKNPEADASLTVKYYSNIFTLGALPSGTYTFGVKPWNSDYAFIEDFYVDAEQTPAPPTPSPTPWREPFVEVTVSEEEVLYPNDDTYTVELENFGEECDFQLIDYNSTWVHYSIIQGHLNSGDSVIITGTVDWSQFSTDASYGFYTTVEVSAPGYVEDIRFYIMLNYNGPTVTPSVPPTPTPTPTTDPGITPTPTPTSSPGAYQQPGDVWFVPEDSTVPADTDFSIEVHACTGTQLIAAYGFDITYDSSIVIIDESRGTSGVDPGPHGYISAANNSVEDGALSISGYNTTGIGPGLDLHFLTIYWTSGSTAGTTDFIFTVETFVDPDVYNVGIPSGKNGNVTVTPMVRGDVNGNGIVDIVDALLTAQYYVGLDPAGFNPDPADVNCDGSVDILDALLIAQYYVGLISGFCL